MNNNIEENANREIWWVLVEIKNAYALTPKDNPVKLNIAEEKSENIPSPDTQRKTIRQLENAGAIKIRKKIFGLLGDNPAWETLYGRKPGAFLLDILQPRFDEIYQEYKSKNLPELETPETQIKGKRKLFMDLKPEITTGHLIAFSDGTIRYKNKTIKLRSQLKELCRLFMEHSDRLLTLDDIKNEIIRADKRTSIPFITISKYVSELHNSLKVHFKKDVIFNQKREGWQFKP